MQAKKAGFIAHSASQAAEEAKKMLKCTLVTHQTDQREQVNRIYIEDGADISKELYLALLVDRQSSRISFVCSTEGGMDIEEVAANSPELILSFAVDPATGIKPIMDAALPLCWGHVRSNNAYPLWVRSIASLSKKTWKCLKLTR